MNFRKANYEHYISRVDLGEGALGASGAVNGSVSVCIMKHIFINFRGSFGDWNNKSLHYILEPLSRRSNSVSSEIHIYSW